VTKVDLKGVCRVRAKGRIYVYAWRGGPRLHEAEGTPAFVEELAAAQAAVHAPDTSRFAGVVQAYRASDAWKDLSAGTRKVWSPWLDRIEEHFGSLSTRQFARPEIKRDIRRWRDKRKNTPRAADMAMQVLSRVMSFAVAEGLIATNPCIGIEQLYSNDRSEIIWEPDDLAKLQAVASPEVWWAAQLALLTGMRQDDCRKLTWSEIGELAIERKASKSRTGRSVLVPIYGELQALLASIPKRAVQVLTNTRGVPWKSGLSDSFADAAKLAGVDKHFHDLRGTAVTRLYIAGFTLREIAEVVAWEEDQVERIINRYVRRDALLRDRIRRLDENSAGTAAAKPAAKPGA
jgi:integrase